MINQQAIANAVDTVELDEALEQAMFNINCELDNSMSYEENREWFAQDGDDGVEEAVEILDAAIQR